MTRPATLYPGKRSLTEIVGFEPVTAEEAVNLAGLGFTTVELPDGSWLAGQHYCQSDYVTRLPIPQRLLSARKQPIIPMFSGSSLRLLSATFGQ